MTETWWHTILTFDSPKFRDHAEVDHIRHGHDDNGSQGCVGNVVEEGREDSQGKEDQGTCKMNYLFIYLFISKRINIMQQFIINIHDK